MKNQIQSIIDDRSKTDREKSSAILALLLDIQRSSDILGYILENWMSGPSSLECLVDFASEELDLNVTL